MPPSRASVMTGRRHDGSSTSLTPFGTSTWMRQAMTRTRCATSISRRMTIRSDNRGGGHSVFLNPPYGRTMSDWMRKAATESQKPNTIVICLVPARTDTGWWWDWVVPYAAEVSFLRGRVKYCLHGQELNSSPFPSCLIRFGGELPKSARPDGPSGPSLF